MIFIYSVLLLLFSLYSYALMDPNITLLNSPVWAFFRDKMVYFGYYQRPLSTLVYFLLIAGLFAFHILFLKSKKNMNPVKLSILIGLLLLFSYPFLSHDFFNYLFDEKILTYYHQNPYLFKALDFPHDQWTRFMHWTHRTYPYGPTFLLVMLPASFLSFGKFLLAFILGKMTFIGLYILSVFYLAKADKKQALFFATNPLIIVEGVMNSHNDIAALSFVLAGMYYLTKKTNIWATVFFILSAGIKYITLPVFVFFTRYKNKNILVAAGTVLLVLIVSYKMEIQPWYFLNIFILLPLFSRFFSNLTIFFAGLLISYYPYILYGDWGNPKNVMLKHMVILIAVCLNLFWLAKKYKFNTISK